MSSSKRILVAPADWGLGHASRCVPIIQSLLKNQALPILATNGRALRLLEKEFPQLPKIPFPAYKIQYPSNNMFWNIGIQLPKLLSTIRKEQQQINKLARNMQIDGIISDCRFGCFHHNVKSVLITHQLNIQIPFSPVEKIVNWKNHKTIRQFDECWIPDWNSDRLAGLLSKPIADHELHYLGPLSRMSNKKYSKHYDLIAVLSGPEPQRTYLEKQIIEQVKHLTLRMLLIQGKTEVEKRFKIGAHIDVISFLTSKGLNEAIGKSGIVLSRSGYTTIMDLAVLQKKAILIPTPGQTEQEYLAQKFHEKKIFLTQQQKDFDLKTALEKVNDYSGIISSKHVPESLDSFIQNFLISL